MRGGGAAYKSLSAILCPLRDIIVRKKPTRLIHYIYYVCRSLRKNISPTVVPRPVYDAVFFKGEKRNREIAPITTTTSYPK